MKNVELAKEKLTLIKPDLEKHSLIKAFGYDAFKLLNQLNVSLETLEELNRTHQRLWNLEDHARSKRATDERISEVKRNIDFQNGKRHKLINKFDIKLQELCQNNEGRNYSETPGEICDRLIIQLLKYNHAFVLQNDATLPEEARLTCIQKVKRISTWANYLKKCLVELLTDIVEGKAVLPPRSEFKMYNNPLLNPIMRSETGEQAISDSGQQVRQLENVKNIVGIACTGHGASISYMGKDGTIRSSVLDRMTGQKYNLMFAKDEINDILSKKDPEDKWINKILTYSFRGFPKYEVFEDKFPVWLNWLLRDTGMTAEDIDLVVTSQSHFVTSEFRLGRQLNRWFPKATSIIDVEHHVIHQRQAFWQSGFEEAAVLTIDTCGEKLSRIDNRQICGTISVMERTGKQQVFKEFLFPESSLGIIYALINHHIGFKQGQEGKTMGLSAFGNDEFYNKIKPFLTLHDDGSFSFLNREDLMTAMSTYTPARAYSWTSELTQKHRNIAYAGQAIVEEVLKNAFEAALRITGQKNLVYAGGVALNSVANEIAIRHAKPENIYISPNPSDTGQSLGAAVYGAYELAKWQPSTTELNDYLGPSYTAQEIEEAVKATKYHYEKVEDDVQKIAQCLANGYIVGRFTGGAEFGPRALGNRSILADPRREDMKDYLNSKVKHREGFRPFAPSALEEHASEWFDVEGNSPFMLRVVPIHESKVNQIPAVAHVDNTARLQTVSKNYNPSYWELINAFKELTGVPIVVNTSFNVAGKPIVETPLHAVECFELTDIDIIYFDNWILSKKPLSNYLNQKR